MGNRIILVGGYCAAGKSTFAHKLAQRLGIPCFHKDTIKETLGEGFGQDAGEVFEKGSAVTFLLMKYIAERFLQAGKICILESNFRPAEIERMKELLAEYQCECLTFIFRGDLEVLFGRYVERERLGMRHWVHKSAGDSREAFREGQLQFGKIALGQTIDVDATSFSRIDYGTLILAAEEFAR